MLPRLSSLVRGFAAALLAASPVLAQDAPPIDLGALLKELQRMREAQTTQARQVRQAALQQVAAAAGSGERAVQIWEEAVRVVQFQGATGATSSFREWKEKEGEALSAPLSRDAARLYFVWLGLTIQRDGGAPVKDLLPQIIAYTKELAAHEQAAEALDEAIKEQREAANGPRRQQAQTRKASDADIRRMNGQILRSPVSSSPVVKAMKLTDFANPKEWPKQPGDLDGILTELVLPELRAQRDPRVLEYWDSKLKKEGDTAAKTKLQFEIEKFTTLRRPQLLWGRAEDLLTLGQKNRAIGEMFTLIRNHPQHPEAANWIARLEAVIAPPAPESASGATGASPAPTATPAQPAAGVVK